MQKSWGRKEGAASAWVVGVGAEHSGDLVAPREVAVCRLGLEEEQKLSWYQIRPKRTNRNTFEAELWCTHRKV